MQSLGCGTICVGTGLLLRALGQDRSKGQSVTTEGQTKSPFPSNSCGQSPGLQEPLRAGGASTPQLPPSLTPAILSTQGKIKTDGAARVSLMNETQAGEGQPDRDLFPWPWLCGSVAFSREPPVPGQEEACRVWPHP